LLLTLSPQDSSRFDEKIWYSFHYFLPFLGQEYLNLFTEKRCSGALGEEEAPQAFLHFPFLISEMIAT
jgi:hypothetical protein